MSLIRVFQLPTTFSKDYCFTGIGQVFTMVDWFRDDQGMMESASGQAELVGFIKKKRYYSEDRAFLVLHERYTLTINYRAP